MKSKMGYSNHDPEMGAVAMGVAKKGRMKPMMMSKGKMKKMMKGRTRNRKTHGKGTDE